MTRTALIIVCLALASKKAEGSYIPSQHPSNRIDIPNARQTLRKPKAIPSPDGRSKRVRLEPVLKKNPLDHLKQQQHGVTESKAKRDPSLAGPPAIDASISPTATREEGRQAFFVSASAALSGFAEVLCLAHFGCFVNMITGTMCKLTTAIANCGSHEAFLHAIFVLCYMAGVAIFAQGKEFARELRDTQDDTTVASLGFVAPVVALIFASADLFARHSKALQIPFLALGFGVVNTAASHATGGTISFALTGHVTQIANAIQESAKSKIWKFDAVAQKSVNVVRSFLGGALLAAVLVRKGTLVTQSAGLFPLCTTLGLLYATLFVWYAPVAPLVRRLHETNQTRVKISRVGRRIALVFARRRGKETARSSPVMVDVYPTQDLLYAADGTQAGF